MSDQHTPAPALSPVQPAAHTTDLDRRIDRAAAAAEAEKDAPIPAGAKVTRGERRSLDLVQMAWQDFPDDRRLQFNTYLISALVTDMPAATVDRAIRAARRCCDRVREQ